MGRLKDELIIEQDRQLEEDRRAEHAVRGLRDKVPVEYDAFDYLYDHDLLPPLSEMTSFKDLEQLADEHIRDLRLEREPLGEDATIYQADQ